VVKNKLAPPFREAHFEILYGRGVHRTAELVDAAESHGIIDKNGTWYSYKGVKLAQGRERMMVHLDDNPQAAGELRDELIARVKQQLETQAPGPSNGVRPPAGAAA